MHYVIHCLDRPGALPTRLAHYDEHKAYLAAPSLRIIVCGPLLADDGETMIGSVFLVEADDHAAVDEFHRNDPFFAAGVWDENTVAIHPFRLRIDNRT